MCNQSNDAFILFDASLEFLSCDGSAPHKRKDPFFKSDFFILIYSFFSSFAIPLTQSDPRLFNCFPRVPPLRASLASPLCRAHLAVQLAKGDHLSNSLADSCGMSRSRTADRAPPPVKECCNVRKTTLLLAFAIAAVRIMPSTRCGRPMLRIRHVGWIACASSRAGPRS